MLPASSNRKYLIRVMHLIWDESFARIATNQKAVAEGG